MQYFNLIMIRDLFKTLILHLMMPVTNVKRSISALIIYYTNFSRIFKFILKALPDFID